MALPRRAPEGAQSRAARNRSLALRRLCLGSFAAAAIATGGLRLGRGFEALASGGAAETIDGLPWDNEVRKGLAAMVRQGLTPRIEIASDEAEEPGCDGAHDDLWYGCVVMSRRWDTTVIPQVMARTAPAEEQLDMALRKLDACHRISPLASIRVLGVRSGQAADDVKLPVGQSRVCSVVYRPDEGLTWTAHTPALHCATEPGTCTTTPCECRRSTARPPFIFEAPSRGQMSHCQDRKLELRTPQGQRCWACSESGKEYTFKVNALAEQMEGQSVSWWPPYGINSPPILWIFMDLLPPWRTLPLSGAKPTNAENKEFTGGLIPWTRCVPIFGPALKRGEAWRFFTFTFFHLQFLDLFQNLLTLLDTLDVEATPPIVLGDGSNLKCGVGAKQNFMCYPSIGLGSAHTLGVALVSSAIGGMCSTWIKFGDVVAGASTLGFGLSGAIVALYALYAGAKLDTTTSVQRNFENWVWLRLIFVGFHIAMEFIRGISQRDLAGLWAHTTAFVAGIAYVLYFLPPMGDGTVLSSDRPYVDQGGFSTSAPECIRLFSSIYEYQVPDIQRQCFLFYMTVVGWTVFNTFVVNRSVKSNKAVLLAGSEVSAICCASRQAAGGGGGGSGASADGFASNMDGKEIILWCEVLTMIGWRPPQGTEDAERKVEIRCLDKDPARQGSFEFTRILSVKEFEVGRPLLDAPAEAEASSHSIPGKELSSIRESIFLPLQYKPNSTYIQIVLYDLDPQKKPWAFASISLAQARAILNYLISTAKLVSKASQVNLDPRKAGEIRDAVKQQLDFTKQDLDKRERELEELKAVRATLNAENGDGTS
eukprot:s1348_g4.t1